MYLPKHFLVEDQAVLAQLISEYPLATIVANLDGRFEINHLPLMLSSDKTKLYGHVARMNPLVKVASGNNTSVTAIFNGPNAYVTPSWYPSKQESGKVVPTWNYAAVHAEGSIKLIEDAQWLRSHVSQMTNIHEPTYQSNWKLDDAPEEYVQMMLKAIIGIEIEISSLVGKFKLSQNRPAEDYEAVVEQLEKSPQEALQEMLKFMRAPK
ncbi:MULTISPECIES: FMN-binding negative transcriptional regulator [unclassified Polynucleobacter]|uniref:FMN-binding negative transcriptional regulator n=1 Tax=unclassified Polynucleobacter TaxID=2640945 RepID=UPI001BFDEF41|nr:MULTISPECIES: FMN-binding negative transcriptional regulator [unclassified Polynucleobacter]MEA9604298.1 FMN-binding negative transcriptional regulator [Polynucleobacter sp. JS-JIR-II-c23]QWE03161.1 FMN-binding negative transcriptional regulator [Polynucleobacter sp. JS-JIR-II-b4]